MMYIEGLDERRKNKEWLGWRLEMSMDRISGCFDPAGIECLAAAYQDACTELHVTVADRALKEIVAKKIISHALRGERDPILLRDAVVAELRRSVFHW
jgi:hypothetical protein